MADAVRTPSLPQWWLSLDGNTEGPHSQAYILACLKTHKLDPTVLACPEGSDQWRCVSEWPQFAIVAHTPVSSQAPDVDAWEPSHARSPSNVRKPTRPRKKVKAKYPVWPWVALGVCVVLLLLAFGVYGSADDEAAPLIAELNVIQASYPYGLSYEVQVRATYLQNKLSDLNDQQGGATFLAGMSFIASLAFLGIGIWRHIAYAKQSDSPD